MCCVAIKDTHYDSRMRRSLDQKYRIAYQRFFIICRCSALLSFHVVLHFGMNLLLRLHKKLCSYTTYRTLIAYHRCFPTSPYLLYLLVVIYILQITGLKEALDHPNSGVTSIYSKDYFWKTWCYINCYRGGHAVFTYPCAGGKCAGAAQKIMYLADDYWRLVGV